MFEVLKKSYDAAIAAMTAANTRRDELRVRYEEFKDSLANIWENLGFKDEKFTLKDGTTLAVSSKGIGFSGEVTNAILNESEEVVSSYLDQAAKKYNDMYTL